MIYFTSYPNVGLNYGPLIYKIDALPLSYKSFHKDRILSTFSIKVWTFNLQD